MQRTAPAGGRTQVRPAGDENSLKSRRGALPARETQSSSMLSDDLDLSNRMADTGLREPTPKLDQSAAAANMERIPDFKYQTSAGLRSQIVGASWDKAKSLKNRVIPPSGGQTPGATRHSMLGASLSSARRAVLPARAPKSRAGFEPSGSTGPVKTGARPPSSLRSEVLSRVKADLESSRNAAKEKTQSSSSQQRTYQPGHSAEVSSVEDHYEGYIGVSFEDSPHYKGDDDPPDYVRTPFEESRRNKDDTLYREAPSRGGKKGKVKKPSKK
jgi:hypothetical protein